MTAALKPGLRVIHPRHGPGTITAVSADAVSVEHDDQDTVRRYVLALCTLTTEAGEPLVKPAPPPPVEHPPTDQHHRRPKALEPKDAAMPAAATPPADTLFADMLAALRTRGPESKALLADACGLQRHSIKNFISQGRIPDHHRDAVRAWIDAPHARPAAKPKATPAKATTRPHARRIAKPAPIPPPAQRLDVPGLLAALGVNLTFAWINDGGDTMRRVRVAVLPA